MIRNLYKVITLGKPIRIPSNRDVCEVCQLTKITNSIPKVLAEHLLSRLALIQFDIAGLFYKSLCSNKYFLLIIDNWTRKNWVIPLLNKSEAIQELRT
jgi:hypothetical protein